MYCRGEQNSEDKTGEKQNSGTKKRDLCQWGLWSRKTSCIVTRLYLLAIVSPKKALRCLSGPLKDSGGSRLERHTCSQCQIPCGREGGELCQNTAEARRKKAELICEIWLVVWLGRDIFVILQAARWRKSARGSTWNHEEGFWSELLASCLHLSLSGGLNPRRCE